MKDMAYSLIKSGFVRNPMITIDVAPIPRHFSFQREESKKPDDAGKKGPANDQAPGSE